MRENKENSRIDQDESRKISFQKRKKFSCLQILNNKTLTYIV